MKKRLILIGAGFIALIIAAIIGRTSLTPSATLQLSVIPQDAAIQIDGKKTKAGTIHLTPGSHKLYLSRDGFHPQAYTITLKAGETQAQSLSLAVTDTPAGQQWLKDHPDQVAIGEGFAGKTANDEGQKITQNNPILQLLPYAGRDYRIDFGRSQQFPDDASRVALYVTAATPTAKDKALTWIRAQGYNPANYEIIYQ